MPLWELLVQTTINFAVGPSGCTDPFAGNYNPYAVIDDLSCVLDAGLDFDSQVINTGSNQTIFIPSDILFQDINFQPNIDLLGAFYLNNGNYILGSEMIFDQNITDGSFQITVWGDDSSTPNTDGFLTGQELIWGFQYGDSGNSLFLEATYLQENADNTFISDGIFSITSLELIDGLAGCYDQGFLEYNPQAQVEDQNLCITEVALGCINPAYIEYDQFANTDDGSCFIPVLLGCMDNQYVEYDQYANTDDGSCEILKVYGCIDPLADNYDPFANTQSLNDNCIYDICVQFEINNFTIEYSNLLQEIVLSFDITNTSEDKTVFAPEFELNLSSTALELGLPIMIISVMYPYNVANVKAVITNDSLSFELDPFFELLSGVVTITSGNVVNGLSPTANCSVSFVDELLTTDHLGCTVPSAYNFNPEATIENGSCVDDVNAVVIVNDPLCYDDYGLAILYLTGGTPPYSLFIDSLDFYTSYSELGIPSELPVVINDIGVVEFNGLDEGVYYIELIDSEDAIFVDSITITIPEELDVNATVESDLSLSSTMISGNAVFYQWLFNGESIDGANNNVHYPQEIGIYQVYVEDSYGCSDYSEEVVVSEVDIYEFNENSFSIYPNPAKLRVSLNLNKLNHTTLISVTDLLGQELNKFIVDSRSSMLSIILIYQSGQMVYIL